MRNLFMILIFAGVLFFLNRSKVQAADQGAWDFATPASSSTPSPLHLDWFNSIYDNILQATVIETKDPKGPGDSLPSTDGDVHVALAAHVYKNSVAGSSPVSVTVSFCRFYQAGSRKVFMLNNLKEVVFLLSSGERIFIPQDNLTYESYTTYGNPTGETLNISCDVDFLKKLQGGAKAALGDVDVALNKDAINQIQSLLSLITTVTH